MAEESKGIALAILGIVAVIAIIGLVLMFSKMKATGEVYSGGAMGEGWAQQNVLPNRLLRVPYIDTPGAAYKIETVTGGGKSGAEAAITSPRKNIEGKAFYQSEYGIAGCQDAVSSGWLEPGYSHQIEKGDGKIKWYDDCYGVTKAWPAGFPSEAIPGYCCKYQPYGQ